MARIYRPKIGPGLLEVRGEDFISTVYFYYAVFTLDDQIYILEEPVSIRRL